MAKTDRSILVSNNQEYGMIADPNKLEASITHAFDKIDQNDDEFIAHKSSGDHDARYYTKTQLDSGQLDNRYYTETELNNGALDIRYYTESEVDTKDANLQNQINTHKISADHDTRYYTKTQLDSGQLDNRYYTETEIDTKVNNLQSQITTNTNDIANRYTKSEVDSKTTNLQSQINNHKTASVLDHPDGSVTTAKLANQAVTREKIAPRAVGPDQLDTSLTQTVELNAHKNTSVLDHPAFSVTTEKLATEAVTFDKLGLDTIGYINNKANQAETNAKTYADQQLATHSADTTKHVTQVEKDAWNAAQAKVNDLEILYWMRVR